MTVEPRRGLITVFLVQHAGSREDVRTCQAAFRQAAVEQFGNPRN